MVVGAFKHWKRLALSLALAWAAAPLGATILLSSDQSGFMQLYSVAADGQGLAQITQLPGGAFEGRWSPDGNHLAFLSFGPTGPAAGASWVPQLFLANPDGSGATALTQSLGAKSGPCWSADSLSLAYHWDQAGASLWMLGLAGGQPTVLAFLPGPARHPSVTSGGTWAVEGYSAGFSGDPRVFWGPLGSQASPVAAGEGEDSEPVWDPAGQRIAFVHRAPGQAPQLWVFDSATGQARAWSHSSASHLHPAWSPDGNRLACSTFDAGAWSVTLVDSAGGETALGLSLSHPQVTDWR